MSSLLKTNYAKVIYIFTSSNIFLYLLCIGFCLFSCCFLATAKLNLTFYLYRNGKILYTNKKTGDEISFDTHITSYQMDSNIYKNDGI